MIIEALSVVTGIAVSHLIYHHFVVKDLKDRVSALTAVVIGLVKRNQLL